MLEQSFTNKLEKIDCLEKMQVDENVKLEVKHKLNYSRNSNFDKYLEILLNESDEYVANQIYDLGTLKIDFSSFTTYALDQLKKLEINRSLIEQSVLKSVYYLNKNEFIDVQSWVIESIKLDDAQSCKRLIIEGNIESTNGSKNYVKIKNVDNDDKKVIPIIEKSEYKENLLNESLKSFSNFLKQFEINPK